jgi:hypothetical protein
MLLNRLLFACSIALFPSIGLAEECKYTNINNVIEPSAEHDKDSICNSQHVQDYEALFYYTGAKASCGDNKAVYCAKVEERKKDMDTGNFNYVLGSRLIGNETRLPLDEQYWAKAFNYCGIDYKAINDKYCENLAAEGKKPNKHAEKNCKPEQLSKLAERVCGGGRSYSAYSESHSAWCGRNYKKADARSKKLAQTSAKELTDNTAACTPRQISFASSKSTSSSSSSNSSSSSSSGSSNTSAPASNDVPSAPTSPAPSGAEDAVNKAKKLKDLFGF